MLTGMELAGPGRQLASASIEKIVLDRNKHQAIILGHSFVSAFDLSGSTPHQTFELGAGALDQRSPQASASNQDGSRWLTGSTGEPWKIFDPAGRIIGERADPHFPMTTSIVNFVFHSLFVTSGMNSRISVMSEELETFIEDLYAFDSVAGMIDLYALDADRFVATDLQGVVIVASLSQSAAVQEICKNLRSFARTASDFAGLAEALEGCKRQTKETLDAPPPSSGTITNAGAFGVRISEPRRRYSQINDPVYRLIPRSIPIVQLTPRDVRRITSSRPRWRSISGRHGTSANSFAFAIIE